MNIDQLEKRIEELRGGDESAWNRLAPVLRLTLAQYPVMDPDRFKIQNYIGHARDALRSCLEITVKNYEKHPDDSAHAAIKLNMAQRALNDLKSGRPVHYLGVEL
ncbi:hypothetical protein HY640_03145 [Candidatus Woesearchaeota archaeon]|nr:hypothetical protein [Candidatus Woesearchaeota archaeon]